MKPELYVPLSLVHLSSMELDSIQKYTEGRMRQLLQNIEDYVFVFGSNLAGRHGKGSAHHARMHYGAIYGQAVGRQGASYGIPTKDEYLQILPLSRIAMYVSGFIEYAKKHPNTLFKVVAIGTGLAGYAADDIRPMFEGSPFNVVLPMEFR